MIRFSLRTLMLVTLAAACGMLTAFRSDAWPLWMRIPSAPQDEDFAEFEFSPDNRKIMVWSPNYVQIWDLESKRQLGAIEPSERIVKAVWARPDRVLLMGTKSHVFDLDTSRLTLIRTLEGTDQKFFSDVSANADGSRFVTFSNSTFGVQLWDFQSGRPLLDLSPSWFSGFSPDGRYFLLRRNENTLEIRNSADGKLLAEFKRPGSDLMGEGWTFEPGWIHLVEAELSDGGEQNGGLGKPEKLIRQRLHRVDLIWRNGVLETASRKFFVEELATEKRYNAQHQHMRRGTLADGRNILNTRDISLEGKTIYTLSENTINDGPFDRGDFSQDAKFIACVRQYKTAEMRVLIWRNQRPEPWWGLAWLPEAWATLFCLAGALVSLSRDRKLRDSAKESAEVATSNESKTSPEQAPVAKAL